MATTPDTKLVDPDQGSSRLGKGIKVMGGSWAVAGVLEILNHTSDSVGLSRWVIAAIAGIGTIAGMGLMIRDVISKPQGSQIRRR